MKSYFKDLVYNNERRVTLNVRFGYWMASDFIEELRDKIYIIPTVCFYFNHSEVFLGFRFLNMSVNFLYEDYKRHDEYVRKCLKK